MRRRGRGELEVLADLVDDGESRGDSSAAISELEILADLVDGGPRRQRGELEVVADLVDGGPRRQLSGDRGPRSNGAGVRGRRSDLRADAATPAAGRATRALAVNIAGAAIAGVDVVADHELGRGYSPAVARVPVQGGDERRRENFARSLVGMEA